MSISTVIDPKIADGDRAVTGFVGVDSGTMCIATQFPDDDAWLNIKGIAWSGPGWACSTSGFGDGGYQVLTVSRDEQLTGVEVMFLSPTIDKAGEDAVLLSHVAHPSEEEKQAVWDMAADEATREKYSTWMAAHSQAHNDAWDRLATVIHPAAESTPTVVTELTVTDDGDLQVGDPCYQAATVRLTVPPGRYTVLAWTYDAGDWGNRVARLGAYRTD